MRLEGGVGDMLLSHYLTTVLLMPEADFGSPAVAGQVRLKHLDALWGLLTSEGQDGDPFAAVVPRYKLPLEPAAAALLTAALPDLQLEALLPPFMALVREQLSEEHIGAEHTIVDIVGYMEVGEDFLTDLPWFRHFPDQLQMKNIVGVIQVLKAATDQL